jgi:oligopeptide transport system ATP-binding protein
VTRKSADGDVNPRAQAPLLEVRDLRVHFPLHGRSGLTSRPRPVVRAVDGVSFQINPGETLGLVGESGSGKTTIARAILRLEPEAGGSILYEGHDLSKLKGAELAHLRRQIQMVFQDPYNALNPQTRVGAAVAEPLIVHRLNTRRELTRRVSELLDLVGLQRDIADRFPHELSGGQRQRVNIARALACEPSLIVADEPTSALDVSVRAQTINLLQELRLKQRLTYLLISHDLSVIRHMSTHVAVMYLGKIVETADRDTLYSAPKHPYTRALLDVIPVPDPVVEKRRRLAPIRGEIPSPTDPPPGCSFHPRCPLAFERCRTEEPGLTRVGNQHFAACFLASPTKP